MTRQQTVQFVSGFCTDAFPLEMDDNFLEVVRLLGSCINPNFKELSKVLQQIKSNSGSPGIFPLKITMPLAMGIQLNVQFTNFDFKEQYP